MAKASDTAMPLCMCLIAANCISIINALSHEIWSRICLCIILGVEDRHIYLVYSESVELRAVDS